MNKNNRLGKFGGGILTGLKNYDQLGILIVLIAIIVLVSIVKPVFLSEENLVNIFRSTSFVYIIGIAMTFVLITGGFDLSVGAVMAMGGILSSMAAQAGLSIPLCVVIGVLFGVGIGVLNGLFVVKLNIPPLIVTLGMLYICQSLILIITSGRAIYPLPDNFKVMGQGSVGGVPNVFLIAIVLTVVAMVTLKLTPYGRSVYSVGGNREAARLSGINVQKIMVSVYILTGSSAALAGILMAARLNSAQPSAGSGYELTVIAAVIIGGTSMFGGSGSVIGTFIGAFLMLVIETSMLLLKISPYWQNFVVGVIIIFAVGLDQYRRKKMGLSG